MVQIATPIGRFVSGDCFKPNEKDQQGNPLTVKTGANKGQPRKEWYNGVAIAKNDPAWFPFWSEVVAQAAKDWPTLFPGGPRPDLPPGSPQPGGCVAAGFAYKISDGDGFDKKGQPRSRNEGYGGHWVIQCTNGYAPKVYPMGHYQPHEVITDPNMVRRGYYIRSFLDIRGNGNSENPGLYLNQSMIEFSGYGPEIISGPDAATAFAAPAAMPAGASAVPLVAAAPATPAPGAPPYTPVAAAIMAPAPVGPGPIAPTPVSPSNPAPTYTGYMDAPPPAPAAPAAPAPAPAPAPPPPPPPPPPAPVRQMTAAATTTYEAYIAQNWTDAQLITHGLMVG